LAGASAGRAALLKDLPLNPLYKDGKPIVIRTEKKNATFELKTPAFRKEKNAVLCMRFQAYLKTPAPGGWNPYLGVVVNGKPLDEFTKTGCDRLLKRGASVRTTLGVMPWWSRRAGYPVLNTFFGPPTELDKRVIDQREDGYWYVLDISDVANYVEIGADERVERALPNRIVFVNTCLSSFTSKPPFPPMTITGMEPIPWEP
jgi:hypothetical protein